MRNEKPDEAHHFLHGAVRVIEECSFLMDCKFVDIFFSRSYGFLADPRNAVLIDGYFQTVPVQGSGFGQFVFEDDADAVALLHLNRGAGAGSVVAPGVDGFERSDFAFHGLGHELEDFHASIHFEGQIRNIRSDHRNERIALRRWFCLAFGMLVVGTVVATFFVLACGLCASFR